MAKKNEKRLCWNCDGEMSLHLDACPYCGTHVNNPFAPTDARDSHYDLSNSSVPKEPESVKKEKIEEAKEDVARSSTKEVSVFLLLVPGVLFALFGLILLLFAEGGTLTLTWNQNVSFFYLLGSIPLIYLGYRAMR